MVSASSPTSSTHPNCTDVLNCYIATAGAAVHENDKRVENCTLVKLKDLDHHASAVEPPGYSAADVGPAKDNQQSRLDGIWLDDGTDTPTAQCSGPVVPPSKSTS
ncbi:hypothetical protein DSO57_1034572 [Entomophthora muscae]|uniref:Uncharacterized protein n=1 Tax=Entomophthora muscae TaxID=34485 RepID=A0ACC2TM87_9FUNG|nr:hypothetical protein DSO57_1034572 [Entomophthora muscae]